MNNSAGYQMLLVFLLSLNFGIVFFDRQALNVLMPSVQPDLMLTQTQIGLIAGGLSFTWAIAAFFVGRLSDTLGKRKVAADHRDDRLLAVLVPDRPGDQLRCCCSPRGC